MRCDLCHLKMPKGTMTADCPYCKAERERQDPRARLRELADELRHLHPLEHKNRAAVGKQIVAEVVYLDEEGLL